MENQQNDSSKDFSLIFKEIERFHIDNPYFTDNGIKEEDLRNDEAIREFSDICREINSSGNNPTVYLTFS